MEICSCCGNQIVGDVLELKKDGEYHWLLCPECSEHMCYKVVDSYIQKPKYVSAIMADSEYVVEYTVGKHITPIAADTKLFVFQSLENAYRWYSEKFETILLCFCGKPQIVDFRIANAYDSAYRIWQYWKDMNNGIFDGDYAPWDAPFGTHATDWVFPVAVVGEKEMEMLE